MAFKNTLGMALEYMARNLGDPLRKRALTSEALQLFEEGITHEPSEPFGYIGKVNLLRQRVATELDMPAKALLKADALALLEEAYEATDESPMIAGELARQRDALGKTEDALAVLEEGLQKRPSDSRLRDLYINLKIEAGQVESALSVAEDGVRFDPTSWRLQRHIARIKTKLKGSQESIRGHYAAAVRHNRGDIRLLTEYGAFLFTNGFHGEARKIFDQASSLREVSSADKTRVREKWHDEQGKSSIFSGRVKELRGASVIIQAIPQNFEVISWRTNENVTKLQVGGELRFTVEFSAKGTIGRVLD